MEYENIRIIRKKLAITQKRLAEMVGYTQAYISAMETGKVEPTPSFLKKLKDLSVAETHANSFQNELIEYKIPDIPKVLIGKKEKVLKFNGLVEIEIKSNPEYAGDFGLYFVFGDEIVLIVGDIAGSGSEIAPLTSYLCGWLEGYLSRSDGRPDIRSLVNQISGEVNRQGFSVAIFIGVLFFKNQKNKGITFDLESVSCGFPTPIILEGPPYTEKRVVKENQGPLPFGNQILNLTRLTDICPPFKIIAASDGLLSRLGMLNEDTGRITLINHFKGYQRGLGVSPLFNDSSLKSDDEICFLLSSDTYWDEEHVITTGNQSEIELIYEHIKERLLLFKINKLKVDGMMSGILEGILNSFTYRMRESSTFVKIRWVYNSFGLRFEIEDQNRPQDIGKLYKKNTGGIGIMKEWFSTVDFRYSDKYTFIVTLHNTNKDLMN